MKIALAVAVAASVLLMGSEEKENKPAVLLQMPLILQKGVTNQVRLRGLHLLAITNAASTIGGVTVLFQGAAEAKPPDGQNAKKVGDHAIELAIHLPEDFSGDAISLALLSTNALTLTNHFPVWAEGTLIDEKEDNNGFDSAQEAPTDSAVRGLINPKKDVDVFSMNLGADEQIRVEVTAERWKSAADTLLTVFNERGHVVAMNDDSFERDSALVFKAKASGRYFVVLQDASDRGGDTHPYLLRFRPVRPQ